ncbi:uroporphyrinogen-III C-methyltransferase [Halomonas sp. V046]|uniref:uroporphyrinogen-III C-methyltransferase n=1 Tax=Halomonas sp. V046 TaxID=3459611 RepID=UPI004044554D
MSNQHNDQDEQQTASSATQGGAGGPAAGKDAQGGGEPAKKGAQRRSRRRDKAASASTAAAAGSSSSSDSAGADGTPAKGAGKPSTAAQSSAASQAEPARSSATGSTGAGASPPASSASRGDAAKDKAGTATDTTAAAGSKAAGGAPKADGGAAGNSASTTPSAGDASKASNATKKGAAGKPASSGAATSKASSGGASAQSKPAPSSGGAGASAGRTGSGSDGSGGGKAGVIALVLVLLVIAGLGFIGWKGWQVQQALNARLDQLKQNTPDVAQLEQLSSQLESGLNERRDTMSQAVDGIKSDFNDYKGEVNQTLDRVLTELSKEQSTDERDWLHAEAAYLLRLANQRLQLERDVDGAVALLRTADARLLEADNPALVPVRRAIAEELAALQSVPSVDRTGLYLALNGQQEQIAGLPLAQDIDELTANATIEEAPTGAWQEQLAKVGEELKELVVVRHHDQALEALMTPEQESYLRQSLRLVLEQSQLALLKEEQSLYEASLDKAVTLLNGYYDLDDDAVQGVIARLEELKGESIHPDLPDISASQQALASFIKQRFESGAGAGQGGDA